MEQWYVLLSLNWGVEERKIQRMGLKTQCSRLTNNFYLVMHLYIDKKLLEPVSCTRKMQIIWLTSFFTLWPFPNFPLSLVISKFNYSKLNMNIHGLKLQHIQIITNSPSLRHILKLSIMIISNILHNSWSGPTHDQSQ